MKDVEELLKKIKKLSKDKDATYLYGVEYSSETDPGFKALVRFSKEGVSPVIVASKTKANLKKQLKSYINGADVKDINVRYHQAQIELEKNAIRFHENLIKEYEEKGEADESPRR